MLDVLASSVGVIIVIVLLIAGTTLRALLLEAYAFWTIRTIMMWGAIASFAFAIIMGILVVLGFRHARRTASDVDLMPHTAVPAH